MKILRSIVKAALILILLLIAVLLFILFLVHVDDNLSEESKNLIDRIGDKSSSEAYLYLFGIYASGDDDPVTAGELLLEEGLVAR